MATSRMCGLRSMRSAGGPRDPNQVWDRAPNPRCRACGFHVRGKGHEQGEHHRKRAA
jgi:hypothetical protein